MASNHDTTREDRIDALVEQCLEALERHETGIVDEILTDHPELATVVRQRIERIQNLGLLDAPDPEQRRPEQIGPYRVLDEIGHGGMGTVYLAEQRGPVRRRVALKVIKRGMDTREVIRRFEVERQALALMDHPNIAKVIDAGTTDDGRPFFAMEYVAGERITKHCDRNRLTTEERLRLFLSVCEAVQHAHHKGIIHRDLKPTNVLVTTLDDRSIAKIIDFGVAKALHQELTTGTLYTEIGRMLGTPEYMSPEQAGRDVFDVDTRTDVYSLGVMLYELLTGYLPFETERLRGLGPSDLQRVLQEEQPIAPSTRVGARTSSEVATGRKSDARHLVRRLRGDLDWIILKALEKDRSRRYATPLQLAMDIRRHLDSEPVEAGPPSRIYRICKFVSKHRAPVAMAGVLMISLLAGIVVTTVAITRERRVRRALEQTQRSFELLSLVERHRRAERVAAGLFPSWPDRIADFEGWLRDYGEPLKKALPDVQATVARLGEGLDGADEKTVFLHDTLRRLVERLQVFLSESRGFYPKILDRLAWARRIEAESIGKYAQEWQRAGAAIRRASVYGGLDLPPQMGLVPLARDSKSGLFEFWHVRSGQRPERDPDTKRWIIGEKTGLVFVLIPKGEFLMGAQRGHPDRPNYDTQAQSNEHPTHEAPVDAFFVSKFELTKGQWKRMTRHPDPSRWQAGAGPITDAEPVESVNFYYAFEVCRDHGLTLPSETQWEYACRAGTSTPWSSGAEEASLHGKACIRSKAVPALFAGRHVIDGTPIYARVDSLAPNRWGLHHMHGNVWEWCLDWFSTYDVPLGEDGGRQKCETTQARRVHRGGSFRLGGIACRAAMRWPAPMSKRDEGVGVRPARLIRRD